MWKMIRRALLVLLLAGLSLGGWGVYTAHTFLNTPKEISGKEILIDITPGSTLTGISRQLQDKGIITDSLKFRLFARYKKAESRFKAGRFALNSGWLPEQILNGLVNGKPVLTRITIPEGLTWWQTGKLLEQNGLIRMNDFVAVINDPEFLRHYGIPFKNAEGFLMPETYLLKTPTEAEPLAPKQARAVVGRLVDTFWSKAQSLWTDGKKPDVENLKKVVILASIIEKETAIDRERPRIAGVYANRLAKGMLLQADPTIIYGLGPDFNGNLTRRDLSDDKNPYNTYKLSGLTPGPICSFGTGSLSAAINPEKHDFLYFVAITDGGAHDFSRTLQEHNRAVQRYLQNRKK